LFLKSKSIKKAGKIVGYVFGTISLLLLISWLLLRSPAIQTWLTRRVAANLSEKLKTRVTVGGVNFEFIKTLVLEDVFIGDLHQDTILMAPKLKVDIGYLGWRDHWLVIDDLSLVNAKIKLKKYKGEHDMAYTFLMDALSPPGPEVPSAKGVSWRFNLNSINVTNMEFVYDFKQNADTSWGMNYRNIRAMGVNARLSNIFVHGDTLHSDVEYLSCRERSGFLLNSLSGVAELSNHSAEFKNLHILTRSSSLNTYLLFTYRDPHNVEDFVDSVTMKAVFNPSVVEMADIAYFAGGLRGIHQKLELKKGTVTGKVNNLKAKDLEVEFGKSSVIKGDISFQGLPDIAQTYIVFKAKSITTNKTDLEGMPVTPFLSEEHLKLPANFAMLGNVRFHGTWEGFLSEFVAYGEFNTAIGDVSSDISLKTNPGNKLSYKGKLDVHQFDIGRFFSLSGFGKLSVSGDFQGSDLNDLNAGVTLKNGLAQSLELNQYTYRNIKFDGEFSRKELKGGLSVEDENLSLRYNGVIDFKGKQPVFDFVAEVRDANLGDLHIFHGGKTAWLSAKAEVNLSGSNLDNLLGNVSLSGINYVQDGVSAYLPEVTVFANENAERKIITLNSDYVDASISGKFTLLDITSYTRHLLAYYVPAFFSDPVKPLTRGAKPEAGKDFSFNVLLKNTAPVSNFFFPFLQAARNTSITGSVNTGSRSLKLDIASKELSVFGNQIADWSLHAASDKGERLLLNTQSSRITFSDSVGLDQFSLATTEAKDSIAMQLNWKNNTRKNYSGDLSAVMKVLSPHTSLLQIRQAKIYVEDSLWKENGLNQIGFDSTRISFHDFGFSSNKQTINLDGAVSHDKTDLLTILVNHFNLVNINSFVRNSGLTLQGGLDSKTVVSDVYHNLVFTSTSTFSQLRVNKDTIGNGMLESVWDAKKEGVYLHGNFSRGIFPDILFSGHYYPSRNKNNLDFDLDLNQLSLSIFQPYVKDFCRNFDGRFSGKLTLKGSVHEPVIAGTISVTGEKVTFNYLNTTYHFRDQLINIQQNSFVMPDFVILDEFENKARVKNGTLTHTNFHNFQLNYPIETSSFMCLNTLETDNPDYYGTAFVSGPVTVSGTVDQLNIEASVKTEKYFERQTNRTHYTNIFIPLENTQEVATSNYIRFVKKDSVKTKNNYQVNMNGISLNFNLEVTPDANIQMIFDQKVGDVIKAKGSGNIQMNISTLGKFSMLGDYAIESGEYLFTLKNLINKKFKIEKGGTISWAGDPKDASINLRADYLLRASLRPVVSSDTSGRRYPVNCIMSLSGGLLQPSINFEIDLPTVDETTQQEVKRNINNEQEVNRQVLALLVLNNFVPPLGFDTQNSGTSAVNTTTSELLSNQLSNWLSQISNDFDLRVKYRPGEAATRDEMELALSTQVLNDRLSVDGSVISGGNNPRTTNTNNLVGDLSVEYKLTKSGKLRLKAYNKTNDNTVLNADAPYSQGVGITYKEEFNTFDELLKRYKEKLRRFRDRNKEIKTPTQPME